MEKQVKLTYSLLAVAQTEQLYRFLLGSAELRFVWEKSQLGVIVVDF